MSAKQNPPKKTNKPAVEPTTEEEEKANTTSPARIWSFDSVFWGLLLIAGGVLLLLGNLRVVDVNWGGLIRLWPLLIVAAGLSILASTHWVWRVVSGVFILGSLLLVAWVGAGFYTPDTSNQPSQSASVRTERNIDSAEITLEAGASSLAINSSDTPRVIEASLRGENSRIEEVSRRSGSVQKITLANETRGAWWPGNWSSDWDVTLTESLPLKLTIDAGASSIDADLSRVKLSELVVDSGASTSTITLGNRLRNTNVTLDAGASTTTLRVPKSSGVKVTFDAGLSSRNIVGLEEQGDGTFQTKDFGNASHQVLVEVEGGLSSFTLKRY